MSTNTCILKFLFASDWKALTTALGGDPPLQAEEFMTANDLVTYATTESHCLVLASIREKNDLIQLANFVKLSKTVAKDVMIKTIVVNFSGNRQFDISIAKLGIADVVEPGVNAKALRYKIDLILKSLSGSQKKEIISTQKINEKENEAKFSQENKVNWRPAIECENDIWLLKNETLDCKKILGRWMIRLFGPGPYAGQWQEVSTRPNTWYFEIKTDSKDVFLPEEGDWFFKGEQKPEFVWKDNIWLVTGAEFELFHEDKIQKRHTRIKLKDKLLEVTHNSPFAKAKEPFIQDSFNKELIVKKDQEDNTKTDIENDSTIETYLEGASSTDNIKLKRLSGKTKAGSSELNPLKGVLKNKEANIASENLSYEGGDKEVEKYWGSKKENKRSEQNIEEDGKTPELSRYDKEQGQEDGKTPALSRYDKVHDPVEVCDENSSGDLRGKSGTEEISTYYNLKEGQAKDKKERESSSGPSLEKVDQLQEQEESSTLGYLKNKKDKPEWKKDKDLNDLSLDELKGESETDEVSKYYNLNNQKTNFVNESEASSSENLSNLYPCPLENKSEEENEGDGPETKENIFDKLRDKEKKLPRLLSTGSNDELGLGNKEEGLGVIDKNKLQDLESSSLDIIQKHPHEEKRDPPLKEIARVKNADHGNETDSDLDQGTLSFLLSPQLTESECNDDYAFLEAACKDGYVKCFLTQESDIFDCEFNDFFDQKIILFCKGLDLNGKVKVDLKSNYLNKTNHVVVEGLVTSIDRDFITIEVDQLERPKLSDFMKVFELRQKYVNVFMKYAKGYF